MESQNNSVKRKYESDDDNSDSPVTNSDDDNSKLFGSESDADNRDSSVTITMSQCLCQGCLKVFPVNTIQNHLNKKKSCKEEYSPEKLLELKEICKEHSRQKKRQKKKASYQSKKKQKNNKVNFSLFVMLNHF